MAQHFFVKVGDTLPAIEATLSNGKGTVTLAGCSVRFMMSAQPGTTPIVAAPASIADAAHGKVSYAWRVADTAKAGIYYADWEVTYPDGSVETYPNDDYIFVIITEGA